MTLYDPSLFIVIPLSSGGPSSSCVSGGGGAGVLRVYGGVSPGGPGVRVDGTSTPSLSWAKSCSGAGCDVLIVTRSVHMLFTGCSFVLSGVVGGVGGKSSSCAAGSVMSL